MHKMRDPLEQFCVACLRSMHLRKDGAVRVHGPVVVLQPHSEQVVDCSGGGKQEQQCECLDEAAKFL